MHSDKRILLLYPVLGVMLFLLLSFSHEGFRWDRSIETHYLPMTVGFTVGSVIAYFRNTIETRTRRYERQLAKEREDALLGRAAAAIAHEVRNPLNAIAMGLQRLQIEAVELDAEHQRLLHLMLDSVHRANGIIGDLLRYSGPLRPQIGSVCLGRLIEELLVLYDSPCKAQGVEVRKGAFSADPIPGDVNLLKQLVENLIRNAMEAQPDGGYLEVELQHAEQEAVLFVRNAGFTLPADEAERIFEPYFTTKAQGTGLGMSIASRIVKAHGGHMQVQTNSNGHVEISTHLPITMTAPCIQEQQERTDLQ